VLGSCRRRPGLRNRLPSGTCAPGGGPTPVINPAAVRDFVIGGAALSSSASYLLAR